MAPEVKVVLYDLAGDELTAGLLDGSLHLAVMIERTDAASIGLHYEELRPLSRRGAGAPVRKPQIDTRSQGRGRTAGSIPAAWLFGVLQDLG
jgi:hypothetical protein